jgi:hypothetical protein
MTEPRTARRDRLLFWARTHAQLRDNGSIPHDILDELAASPDTALRAALFTVTDIIMSEPPWPRPGAIRRRVVMDKIRDALTPEAKDE